MSCAVLPTPRVGLCVACAMCRAMSRAMCRPRQESRCASPTPQVASCVACAMCRTVSRTPRVVPCVAHAMSYCSALAGIKARRWRLGSQSRVGHVTCGWQQRGGRAPYSAVLLLLVLLRGNDTRWSSKLSQGQT